MKTYLKIESGDIIVIESKREYEFKNIQSNGTITTIGDISNIKNSKMKHTIIGVIENERNNKKPG